MHGQRRLLCLLAILVALPVAGALDAQSVDPVILEYEIEATREDSDGKKTTKLTTTVYVLSHEGNRLQVVIVGTEPDLEPGDLFANTFPLCTIVTERSGTSEVGLVTQTGAKVSKEVLMPLLAHGVPTARRTGTTEGTEQIELDANFNVVPLHYSTKPVEGNDGRFVYESKLERPVPVALGSMQLELQTLDRVITFEGNDPYPLEGTWKRAETRKTSSVRKIATSFQARRTSSKPLPDKDAKAIIAELDVYDALLDDLGRGTEKSLQAAEKKMKTYRTKHSEGLLASAADATEKLLSERLRLVRKRTNPKAQRDKLKGKLAPDFELVDMDDKKHSLKDYRGKIVLLNFYGVG